MIVQIMDNTNNKHLQELIDSIPPSEMYDTVCRIFIDYIINLKELPKTHNTDCYRIRLLLEFLKKLEV